MKLRKLGMLFLPISMLFILSSGACSSKQAERAIKTIEREWKAANESDGVRFLKTKHRAEQVEEWLNNRNYNTPCYQCGGYGVVYYIDAYGNPVEFDYYGNIVLHECPECHGRGYK